MWGGRRVWVKSTFTDYYTSTFTDRVVSSVSIRIAVKDGVEGAEVAITLNRGHETM